MNEREKYSDQEHYVNEEYQLDVVIDERPIHLSSAESIWRLAWRRLKHKPTFWFCFLFLIIILLASFFPFLFTNLDPQFCVLNKSLAKPVAGHWLGFDRQGCDIFARIIYGTRASVMVGFLTTFITVSIGCSIGALAGYYGSVIDSVLSRFTDIFFAIPLFLAAIVIMQLFKDSRSVMMVVMVLSCFGWASIARIMRSSVMVTKNYEYNTAAKSMGLSRFKILLYHVFPNSLAPVIVYATVALGIFIVTEATLSFMGIGLPPSLVSWGTDIAKAQASLRIRPMVLFYPSLALALTVLSFILLGEVVKDALDPKSDKY